MENLLPLLPLLACPVMMGVMMMLMTRTGGTNPVPAAREELVAPPVPAAPNPVPSNGEPDNVSRASAPRRSSMNVMGLCLNWKVLGALGLVALGVWAVAPSLIGVVLPLLLVAACPLSMLLMMRGGQGAQCAPEPVEVKRAGQAAPGRLTALKGELQEVEARQEAIRSQIAALEPGSGPADGALIGERQPGGRGDGSN